MNITVVLEVHQIAHTHVQKGTLDDMESAYLPSNSLYTLRA